MPRALLIGGSGFVGRHLAARLREANWSISAFGRERDIRDLGEVRSMIAEARPEAVVNLAALTTVKETEEHPDAAAAITVTGLRNVLTALGDAGFTGRLLQVSSSEVYGHPPPEALPLTENSPPDPQSPYARAKLEAEELCRSWDCRFEILVARPFTHIGPGQSPRFAAASWTQQLTEIAAGLRQPLLEVGSLSSTRDLTDVRDVVHAYELLLEKGRDRTTYNVCSGREVSMAEVLAELIRLSGLEVEVRTDPARLRRAEQQRLVGSASLIGHATDWDARIPLSRTLADMLHSAEVSRSLARL